METSFASKISDIETQIIRPTFTSTPNMSMNEEYSYYDDTEAALNMSSGFDPYLIETDPKPWPAWSIECDFEIGKQLESGRYGQFYLTRTKKDKRIIALNIISVSQIKEEKSEYFINRETEIHCQLKHKNILNMFGYFHDFKLDKIVFVLEYAVGGDIWKDLAAQPGHRYPAERAATFIDEVCDALQYLHADSIIHRNIRPETLQIGYFGEIKLADFGCAVRNSGGYNNKNRRTLCWNLDYTPPEMLIGDRVRYNEKVDLWAVGVLTYQFLAGFTPFAIENGIAMYEQIFNVELDFPSHLGFTSPAIDLIQKILQKNPAERISLQEIREHAWIMENKLNSEPKLLPCFDKFKPFESSLIEKYNNAAQELFYRHFLGIKRM